jgi:hypothetical protein
MAMFRCFNSKCVAKSPGRGFEFTSATGVCPSCGADARNPRLAHLVHKIEIIHYDPPSGFDHVGLGHNACDPTKFGPHACGAHAGVTCPKCRETDVFKQTFVEHTPFDEDIPEEGKATLG